MPLPQHVLDKVNTSGEICSQASVLVSINEHGRFHKYAQQGPLTCTKEWEQLYRKAGNLVEARNHSMKSMVAIGKGERTKRYMRGIGAFLFLIGLAVARTNALLAMNYLRRQVDEDLVRNRLGVGACARGALARTFSTLQVRMLDHRLARQHKRSRAFLELTRWPWPRIRGRVPKIEREAGKDGDIRAETAHCEHKKALLSTILTKSREVYPCLAVI